MQRLPARNSTIIQEFRDANSTPFVQIYTQIYPKRPFSSPHIKNHIQRILDGNGRIWTITQQNNLIGYAAVYPVPGLPNLAEIEGGIIPIKQRQGFASQLLHHIINVLHESTTQQISLTVSSLEAPAAHFLLHHNFFIEHEEHHLQLDNLQSQPLHLAPCTLHLAPHETAVSTFPTLYDQSFAGTRWHQPYSPDEIDITLSPTDEMLFYLYRNNPIGFAWIRFPNTTTAEIEPIGVVKEMQGKGYGRSLLNAVLHKLQQQGIQQVQLGVWADNQIARHLYHKFGFRHQSTTTYLAYNL
ncbi:MAG: GNAT family N-acetyltransferase [Chloroflexi bacterium]|nr:MAG: GNAT family N-acetyltransferase [Chloroflexota bacterium]